ncbi:MAG: phosphoribosylformylglycinamidine cyclo-ligase [Thermomicrobiales bacterium]|nr:phosphoribosylformylglycinamidine cyclo-ligase [Thermomicrobiales bacterium]
MAGDGVSTGLTYRDAGVDIDRAAASLSAIGKMARSTLGSAAGTGEIGHFGGVYPLPAGPDRLLVASADGIGTKIKLAFATGGSAHARVGGDLVRHCVNDLLACGARPLFFLDYIAMGKLDTEALEGLVEGMAEACRENGLALIGGETAEMPGLYSDGEYDAAGFIVGEVDPFGYIDGSAVAEGDVLIGFPSIGLHTNGYSLARRIVGLTGEGEHDRALLDQPLSDADGLTLGDALLAPHPSYQPAVRQLLDGGIVHGMAHITGGGLLDNVPRMIPDGLRAEVDPSTWSVPSLIDHLNLRGNVDPVDRYRAFNMGIGFVVAVSEADAARSLLGAGDPRVIGRVGRSTGTAKIVIAGVTGDH